MPHQHTGVEHVRAARQPIHQRRPRVVGDCERGQPGERAQRIRDRSFVGQGAYPVHYGKGTHAVSAGDSPQQLAEKLGLIRTQQVGAKADPTKDLRTAVRIVSWWRRTR